MLYSSCQSQKWLQTKMHTTSDPIHCLTKLKCALTQCNPFYSGGRLDKTLCHWMKFFTIQSETYILTWQEQELTLWKKSNHFREHEHLCGNVGLEAVCMFIFSQLCLLKDVPINDIPPICEEMTCLSFWVLGTSSHLANFFFHSLPFPVNCCFFQIFVHTK